MEQPLSFADSDYQRKHQLTRKLKFTFADAGYRGADKRSEPKSVNAEWYIPEHPSVISSLNAHLGINKVLITLQH